MTAIRPCRDWVLVNSLAPKARVRSSAIRIFRHPVSSAKGGSPELAPTACGETSRLVTALGLNPRAARLRSSTLRLTVGGISLARPRDRVGSAASARARVFESLSRRCVPKQFAESLAILELRRHARVVERARLRAVWLVLPRFESWWRHPAIVPVDKSRSNVTSPYPSGQREVAQNR